jgi:hypothetical protein
MWRGTWVTWAVGLTLLVMMFVLPGCWNPFKPDGGTDPIIPGTSRDTPDHLLSFFAGAYKNRSIDGYAESLDDSYTYTFAAKDYDAAGVSADKPYWGKSEDVPRTANMFDAPTTKDILVDWLPAVANWEVTQDSIFVNSDHWETVPGYTAIFQPDIKVTVAGGAGNGEDLTYWVHLSRIVITAIHDRLDPKLWTILRFTEVPVN